jgi:hypothetical protein
VLNSPWAINRVSVELKISVSEILVSVIMVDLVNEHMSLIVIPVSENAATSFCCTMQ